MKGSIHATKLGDANGTCANGCSLREAIIVANNESGSDTIVLSPGIHSLSIKGNGEDASVLGDLDIRGDLVLLGTGATSTIVDAKEIDIDRVFHVIGGNTVTFNSLTIQNGVDQDGGGIFVGPGSTVTIQNSTILNNTATRNGGGIFTSQANITIRNSTLANNAAEKGNGGGIFNSLGPAIISRSTLSDNHGGAGGGIFNDFLGTVEITNSTLANNSGGQGGAIYNNDRAYRVRIMNSSLINDHVSTQGLMLNKEVTVFPTEIGGSIIANLFGNGQNCFNLKAVKSFGYNLVSDNSCGLMTTGDKPNVNPKLGNYIDPGNPGGGRFPLLVTSPAIDAGNNNACPSSDQLNRPRPVDGGGFQGDGIATCDIGAIEFYPNVNLAVDFAPTSEGQTTEDTAGCPNGFVGKFNFTAKLQGEAQNVPPLSDLFVEVETLTNGNLLHNAERGPGGVGAILTVPRRDQYADGRLEKREFVNVPFTICLKSFDRFDFFVNVFGHVHVTK